jgi:hypothetical protein
MLAALKAIRREIADPKIAEDRGRITSLVLASLPGVRSRAHVIVQAVSRQPSRRNPRRRSVKVRFFSRAPGSGQIGNAAFPPDLAVYGCDDERRVLSAVNAVGGGAQIPSLSERRGPASVEPRPLLLSSELDLELSPNFGDGLRVQAAAVWDCEDAGLAATSIPSVNLTP